MKAKLAASDCDKQIKLIKQLIESEWIVVESVSLRGCTLNSTPWMLRLRKLMYDRVMTNDYFLGGACALSAMMLSHLRLCNDLW